MEDNKLIQALTVWVTGPYIMNAREVFDRVCQICIVTFLCHPTLYIYIYVNFNMRNIIILNIYKSRILIYMEGTS
jgi:hypothetical protein